MLFFFKQKTAYEISYGDWSSDVCSSDLDTATTEIYTSYDTLSLHDALPSFRPRIPLAEGLARTIAWYRAERAAGRL